MMRSSYSILTVVLAAALAAGAALIGPPHEMSGEKEAATVEARAVPAAPSRVERIVTPWDEGITLVGGSISPVAGGPDGVGPGIQAAADHVIAFQCANGGWGWPHTPCPTTTFNNITAPICRGLLSAYAITGDPDHLAAAVNGGNYDLTFQYGNGESRFGSHTAAFLHALTGATSDPAYSNHAATKFFDELTAGTYGPSNWDTVGFLNNHKTQRSGGLINLRPWDMQYMPWVAGLGLIGNATSGPADPRPQQQTFLDDSILDGLNTLDQDINPLTDFGDVIGLAGAVHALALSGTTSFTAINSPNHPDINGISTLCALANVLAGYQNADGSWYWLSDPGETKTESDKDTQTTSYAVMALAAAHASCPPGYASQIAMGRDWLRTMQLPDGGFRSYPGGGSNIEAEGEAADALEPDGCTVDKLVFELGAGSDCVKPGDPVIVKLWQRALDQNVRGFQAFAQFDSSRMTHVSSMFTTSPYGLVLVNSVSGDNINMAAGIDDPGGQLPTMIDAELVSMNLTAGATEGPTTVSFRANSPPSRFTDASGLEVVPCLVESPTICIDGTPPVITCPPNLNFQCIADVPAAAANLAAFVAQGGSASDSSVCNTSLTVTHMGDSTSGTGCTASPYVVLRTYRATDCAGNFADCVQTITVIDNTAPVITCPPNVNVNADAGGCTASYATVSPGTATATDNCDPSPSITGVRSDALPLTDPYPSGVTTITWTATDDCGNSSQCPQTITVSAFNELLVNVQLSPTMVAGPLTRCITFELWDCTPPPTIPIEIVSLQLTFNNGTFSGPVLIPCGNYECITARDRRHTLRRTDEAFGIVGTQYVADFTGDPGTGGDWLIGGNLNDDFWIDILDFGMFSFQYGTNFGTGNTTCATAMPHADINGDGLVDTLDYTFIGLNFLKSHEANCCGRPDGPAGPGGEGPVTSITVKELERRGLGHLRAGDLNGDGVLNVDDIAAFMAGARPAAAKDDR